MFCCIFHIYKCFTAFSISCLTITCFLVFLLHFSYFQIMASFNSHFLFTFQEPQLQLDDSFLHLVFSLLMKILLLGHKSTSLCVTLTSSLLISWEMEPRPSLMLAMLSSQICLSQDSCVGPMCILTSFLN